MVSCGMAQAGRPREFHEDEVLDRGIDYFRIHGYGGGGLSGLLEHTGLSRQSLYNSFGDKRDFFRKCLVRYRQVWGERLFAKLGREDADLNVLKEVLLDLVEHLSNEPDKNCLIVKTTMEMGRAGEDFTEQIRIHSKRIAAGVRAILKHEAANRKRGRGRQEKGVERGVALVLSVIFGLHVMARSGMGSDSMREAVFGLLDGL